MRIVAGTCPRPGSVRRPSSRAVTALRAALAGVSVAGLLASTGCGGASEAGGASCVGLIVIHGHRYWPWDSTRPVRVTGRPLEARVPSCHDTPGDHAPDGTTVVHEIRGVDVAEAVAGGVIERPPRDGRRVIFVRDAPAGHRSHLPQSVRDLVKIR